MAAKLILETDPIEIANVTALIYGPPGVGKTSAVQTAEDTLTLDFDRGIHRSYFRRATLQFASWEDTNEIAGYLQGKKTVVVDTVGRLLDMLSIDIIRANSKHGSAAGGLSLQGYAALKSRFTMFMTLLRAGGRDVVMTAHEKEEKDGDDRYMRPDIQGGSYTEVHKVADLMGYLYLNRAGQRTLDFNPTDRWVAKGTGQPAVKVPDFDPASRPDFLGALLADAKKRLGQTAAASSRVAQAVEQWQARLTADPSLEDLNKMLGELSALDKPVKRQVWHLIQDHATRAELVFDQTAKRYERKDATPGAPEEGAA